MDLAGLAVDVTSLVAAVVFLGLNAFFVAAEFSIVKVRRTRLEELAGKGLKAARVSLLCVNDMDDMLSATQLGITLASLGLGWVGEPAFAHLLSQAFPTVFPTTGPEHHVAATAISFFLLTFFHVVLGELVPKTMAIAEAEKITLWISRPLRLFYQLSKPFIRIFSFFASAITRALGYGAGDEEPLSEQELKLVMKESKEDGVISENEAQIITRAFEFSDKRVSDIMVNSEKVDYLSLARPLDQNLALMRSKMRTRFPLCETDLETVVGTVHIKDVWPILLSQFSNEAFRKACRPPIFVGPSLRQDQLMKLFQSCRAHLAVVRESDGRSAGIVTLEDVLESLVGDIRDEHGN